MLAVEEEAMVNGQREIKIRLNEQIYFTLYLLRFQFTRSPSIFFHATRSVLKSNRSGWEGKAGFAVWQARLRHNLRILRLIPACRLYYIRVTVPNHPTE